MNGTKNMTAAPAKKATTPTIIGKPTVKKPFVKINMIFSPFYCDNKLVYIIDFT